MNIFYYIIRYLYNKIPEKILDTLKLPLNDMEIDLLIITNDNKYIPVQCKYRSCIKSVVAFCNNTCN